MAKKKARGKPYIGDQVLAIYQALVSCCGLGLLSILSAASFGLAIKPAFLKDFQKENPSDVWKYLSDPKYTVAIGIGLALLAAFKLWWLIATWRGRRWSFWVHGVLSGLAVAPALMLGVNPVSLIFPAIICIYCVLRLTGNVGPKGKAKR